MTLTEYLGLAKMAEVVSLKEEIRVLRIALYQSLNGNPDARDVIRAALLKTNPEVGLYYFDSTGALVEHQPVMDSSWG